MNKKMILRGVLLVTMSTSPFFGSARDGFRFRSDDNGVNPGFTFYGGTGGAILIHRSFGEFRDAYNDYYGSSGQDVIDKELSNFGLTYGYRFGARYTIGLGVGFSVNHEQMYADAHVEFKTGEKRHFKHIIRTPSLGFSIEKKYFRAEYKLGLGMPIIESSFEYADGTVSYGKEKALNGIFTGFSFFGGLEAAVKVPLGNAIHLELGTDLSGYFMGYYEDASWRKGEVYVLNYGFVYPMRLPTDFDSYTTVSWDNYDDTKAVKSKAFYPGVFINFCIDL